MKKAYVNALIWVFAAVICIVLLSTNAFGEELAVEGMNGGPGVCYGEDGAVVAVDFEDLDSKDPGSIPEDLIVKEKKSEPEAKAGEDAAAISDEPLGAEESSGEASDQVFTLDGVQYKKGTYWGSHRLTGYSGAEWGTDTASGATATEGRTVSATSQLPFGTVLIIDGGSGPYVEDYNSIYVVEDRGGSGIENDGIVDLFFEDHQDAVMVTHYGWNYAEIWIAEPV